MTQTTQDHKRTPQEILQHWLSYCEYDPEQRSFNLLGTNYQYHKACKKMAKAMEYEPSGVLALLYAKEVFLSIVKTVKQPVFDYLSDPGQFDEDKKMYDLFMSPTLTDAENALLDSISDLVQEVVQRKQIGERDRDKERETLLASVSDVIEELTECKVSLYQKGGAIQKITRFFTRILLFERLSECLLALEKAEDGMYLCYVNNGGTADGYFGFYIKSNGSLLSVSERVDEAYPGQHKNSRNGRWSEGKKYSLFPYNYIFSFSNLDYKGYAHNHTIDDTKLDFCALEPNAYMPLVLAMVMLASRYANADVSGMKLMLVDSLFQCNLDKALPGTEALIVPSDSALALPSKNYVVPFSAADVLGLDLPAKLSSRDRHYSEQGTFPKEGNIFVKLYGDGFELDKSKLLVSDPKMKALPPEQWESEQLTPNAEFVGSADRMELIAYVNARKQLADYIRAKMCEQYLAFGGAEGMNKWFDAVVRQRQEYLFKLCVQKYYEVQKGIGVNITNISFSAAPNTPGLSFVSYFADCKKTAPDTSWYPYPFNGEKTINFIPLCPFTGNRTSMVFFFRPEDCADLEFLFGSVPDVLRGWNKRGHRVYGNPLLDATDACSGIGTLFEYDEQRINPFTKHKCSDCWEGKVTDKCTTCPEAKKPIDDKPRSDFHFGIAFSKNGFKSLLKKFPTEMFSEALSGENVPADRLFVSTEF